MTAATLCFMPDCTRPSLPSEKFCARHLREAERWLTEQSRLDDREDQRRRMVEARADPLEAILWDDPDVVAEDVIADEDEVAEAA